MRVMKTPPLGAELSSSGMTFPEPPQSGHSRPPFMMVPVPSQVGQVTSPGVPVSGGSGMGAAARSWPTVDARTTARCRTWPISCPPETVQAIDASGS